MDGIEEKKMKYKGIGIWGKDAFNGKILSDKIIRRRLKAGLGDTMFIAMRGGDFAKLEGGKK